MRVPGRNTVRGKLFFVVLVASASALLITGVALAAYELRELRQSRVSDLNAQAEILGLAAAPALIFQDPQAAEEYLSLLEAKPEVTSAAIYTATGARFASYSRSGSEVSFPDLPAVDGHYFAGDGLTVFKRIVASSEIVGSVSIRADYDLSGQLADYLGILAVILAISLAGAASISHRLQRTITQPISAVTAVARQVMERRDYSLRAPKSTTDEIGLLVDAFNGMLDELGSRTAVLEQSVQERRRAEEELRTLNAELEDRVAARTSELESANSELESFSYSVSHDLRAPLRAVSGFSNLLWQDHGEHLDEEARRKIDIIRTQADKMGQLIDDLLTFSRLGRKALQPSELDMAEMAGGAFERLRQQAENENVELQMSRLPPAMADRNLMENVWANLLSNAIKFSSQREKPVVEVGAIVSEDENIYYVRDNGAGFDPRYNDKLFGVFQRLHDESEFPGTGVGLALVQRIVTRHGGRIWADSRPDDGATFHFSLPKETRSG